MTEGALFGVYSFRKYITKEAEHGEIKQLMITGSEANLSGLQMGSNKGRVLAEATNLARDMVNEPANYMTPRHMAERAMKLAETYGLELGVLERHELRLAVHALALWIVVYDEGWVNRTHPAAASN